MHPLNKSTIMAKIAEGLPLTPGEVAHLFQVNPKTAARWCEGPNPRLESFKTFGGHRRIPASAILAALRRIEDL